MKLMPAALTVPEPSSIVMVPAVPLLPMLAMSPLTQALSAAPLLQFAPVVVFQLPLPSVGVTGLMPLESHVCVAANVVGANIAATIGVTARASSFDLRFPEIEI